ncbi:hypothetical protein [Actinocorallia populi]|uniref:hypothetical protein n=1 Tax=Actinocorallia populi TaxID=2079200 RepID=UPI000D08A5AF|nr:hypothetical protein [Actinocorallia populi]
MPWEAAYAVQLKQAIDTSCKEPAEAAHTKVERLFVFKNTNLHAATDLLDKVLIEYDISGM